MADGLEEEDEGLFRKWSTTEDETNPANTVASYQEQYQEGNIIFERRVELFGVRVSFKATTNPPIDPTQTAKVLETNNPHAPFITETSKKDDK